MSANSNFYEFSLAFLIGFLLLISSASAADPGHSAGVVGAGTFESGMMLFPKTTSEVNI